MNIPLIDVQAHRAHMGNDIDERIRLVLEHGKYIMGPEVAELEAALVDYVGVQDLHAITCANGTDALVMGLQALGIKPGDAVICPSFTFVATAEAIALLGGIPVFADVSPTSFNLETASLRAAFVDARSRGLRVVGTIAVDLFGQPADYAALRQVTDENGSWLLADAAQSFGAERDGTRVGALAAVTTTSFFPAKPLGCYGDGGAIFTTDTDLADVLRSLRVHGKGTNKYDNVRVGQNSRLDTLQAAVLIPKLAALSDEIDARSLIADRYAELLPAATRPPTLDIGVRSAWAQYTIQVANRSSLQLALSNAGIGHAVYYPVPLHLQPAYIRHSSATNSLTTSEALSTSVLSLPMYPYLELDAIEFVSSAVSQVAADR